MALIDSAGFRHHLSVGRHRRRQHQHRIISDDRYATKRAAGTQIKSGRDFATSTARQRRRRPAGRNCRSDPQVDLGKLCVPCPRDERGRRAASLAAVVVSRIVSSRSTTPSGADPDNLGPNRPLSRAAAASRCDRRRIRPSGRGEIPHLAATRSAAIPCETKSGITLRELRGPYGSARHGPNPSAPGSSTQHRPQPRCRRLRRRCPVRQVTAC